MPADTLHQLPVGTVLGHCCTGYLLPAGLAPDHPYLPCWPRTRCIWGAESLPSVQKGKIPPWKLCALSLPFTVPPTKSQLLWTEMEEKGDASGWILVYQCKLYMG